WFRSTTCLLNRLTVTKPDWTGDISKRGATSQEVSEVSDPSGGSRSSVLRTNSLGRKAIWALLPLDRLLGRMFLRHAIELHEVEANSSRVSQGPKVIFSSGIRGRLPLSSV